jgi:hypothetical protein
LFASFYHGELGRHWASTGFFPPERNFFQEIQKSSRALWILDVTMELEGRREGQIKVGQNLSFGGRGGACDGCALRF